MIIDIRFKNHKSFKNENLFSMEATDTISKEENVVTVNDSLRVLKVGVIYGANASGKSNFLSLLFLLMKFVGGVGPLGRVGSVGFLYQPFLLSPDGQSTKSEVTIKFVAANGVVYEYFIRYTHSQVIDESVYRYEEEAKTLICTRERSGADGARVNFNPFFPNNEGLPVNVEVQKTASILTPFLSIEGNDVSVVARYIVNMQYDDVFYVPSHYEDERIDYLASWIGNDKEKKSRILSYLKLAKTGIEDFEIKKSTVTQKSDIYFVHKVYDDNHNVVGSKRFPYEMESDGTIKLLFYAIRAISALDTGAPLFVDEINESLHTQLTKELIKMFISPITNPKGAQLIATMHDVNLMDETILRRDQIWFVQKDDEGVSEMYSLVDFRDTDETTSYAKWYMANRFGATPKSPNVNFMHYETAK